MSHCVNNQVNSLQSLAEDARERFANITPIDPVNEINSHYDEIMADLMLTMESNVSQLRKHEADLLELVNEHRGEAIRQHSEESFDSSLKNLGCDDSIQAEIADLGTEVDSFCRIVENLTSSKMTSLSEQDMERVKKRAEKLNEKSTYMIWQMRQDLIPFKLKFDVNPLNQSIVRELVRLDSTDSRASSPAVRISEEALAPNFPLNFEARDAVIVLGDVLVSFSQSGLVIGVDARPSQINSRVYFSIMISGHSFSTICEAPRGHIALGDESGQITLLDYENSKHVSYQIHQACVVSICQLKDYRIASMSTDDTIVLCNIFAPQETRQILRDHGCLRFQLQLCQLSNGFLVTCSTSAPSTLRVWDINRCKCVLEKQTSDIDTVCSLAVLTNDTVAVAFTNGSVKLVNLFIEKRGKLIIAPRECIGCFERDFSPIRIKELPYQHLLVIDYLSCPELQVWNTQSSCELVQRVQSSNFNQITSCSLCYNKRRIITCSHDNRVEIRTLIFTKPS